MIKVKIGGDEREWENADESWINQQINRRIADGLSVCVRVSFDHKDLQMTLSTPTCAEGGGGSRPLRPREKKVLDLWTDRGLNESDFRGGNLIAFLRQLKHIL